MVKSSSVKCFRRLINSSIKIFRRLNVSSSKVEISSRQKYFFRSKKNRFERQNSSRGESRSQQNQPTLLSQSFKIIFKDILETRVQYNSPIPLTSVAVRIATKQ